MPASTTTPTTTAIRTLIAVGAAPPADRPTSPRPRSRAARTAIVRRGGGDRQQPPAERRPLSEAVDRRCRAGPHDARAEQRQHPRRAAGQRAPWRLHDAWRVHGDQRAQPHEQRRVLHRVPCPVPAPALLDVRPHGAERHGHGDECQRRPQPRPRRRGQPGRLATIDGVQEGHQRGCETCVQDRRVHGHRRVLQDRRSPNP